MLNESLYIDEPLIDQFHSDIESLFDNISTKLEARTFLPKLKILYNNYRGFSYNQYDFEMEFSNLSSTKSLRYLINYILEIVVGASLNIIDMNRFIFDCKCLCDYQLKIMQFHCTSPNSVIYGEFHPQPN